VIPVDVMDNEPEIAAIDVGGLERWLNDPAAPLDDLRTQLPFLRSDVQARRFLNEIREGLEDVRLGRTVPHEAIVRDVEERRRRGRANAAE